jgi:hypothetical protein
LFDQLPQHPRPVRTLLLLHQLLCSRDIADPRKTVLLSPIPHPRFVHLPPQPFSPVHTDLYQKGKPRLQAKMQKPQLFVHPVKIKMRAFPPLKTQLQLFTRSVPPHAPPPARLYATDERYQSPLDPVTLLDLARLILLARTARGQIDYGPPSLPGHLLGGLTNTARQTDGELLEVFPHHPGFSQVLFHHWGIIQTSKRPLQPQPIPPVQYPDHIARVPLYECSSHRVLQQIVSVCSHDFHLHHGSAFVTLVAAFAARGSLRLR